MGDVMVDGGHVRRKASRSPLRARACLQQQQQLQLLHNAMSKPVKNNIKGGLGSRSTSASPPPPDEAGSPRSCSNAYNNPTYSAGDSNKGKASAGRSVSLPTTSRENAVWKSAVDRFRSRGDDWERTVVDGKESKDGTHLIRILADILEEFQFGSSNSGKGEYANWIHDPKSLPLESRHSHQLAGQLRRLADVFEKENTCSPFKGKRVK